MLSPGEWPNTYLRQMFGLSTKLCSARVFNRSDYLDYASRREFGPRGEEPSGAGQFTRMLAISTSAQIGFGPFQLVRELDATSCRERWLALHEVAGTIHLVYRHRLAAGERRRFARAVETVSKLRLPHVLEISHFAFCDHGLACLVTPYPGTPDGVLTVDRLCAMKGGRLTRPEVMRAVEQLLKTSRDAHLRGFANGPFEAESILVDRAGRIIVDLYGLALARRMPDGPNEAARIGEIRSIVQLAHRWLLGVNAPGAGGDDSDWDGPHDFPGDSEGHAGGSTRRDVWHGWLARGLSPEGFASAAQALAALRHHESAPPAQARVKVMRNGLMAWLGRFRRPESRPQQA